MKSAYEIALWTYLAPVASTRAFRIALLLFIGIVALIGLLLLVGLFSTRLAATVLAGLREFIVFPGIPIFSILFSEIPLRDGIHNRTLLYPLLGPVSRATMALVRTVATGALLAVGGTLLVLIVHVFEGGGFEDFGREALAITLGAFCYTSLFGLVHLVSRRGLIAGLAIFGIFDEPLARLPFSLRVLSPSYHVRSIADQTVDILLPIRIGNTHVPLLVSVVLLLGLAAVFTAAIVVLFRRKNLGELC